MSPAVDFSVLANPSIRLLKAYDPGHDIPALRSRFATDGGLLELGSNENCYGPSPAVYSALAAEMTALNRYPDPSGKALKMAIARTHGIDASQIILGNGSHELLMQLAQVFAGPQDEILVSRYCFAVYPIATQAAGAELVVVDALPENSAMPLGHDLDALAAGISERTKLIFFANPNNPTGTWFPTESLAAFMAKIPATVLVVVDEAYVEFADDPALVSALPLRERYANLIIARTFSKAHGLAALRAGYLVADASVVRAIEPIRESFNLNALALAAAHASLADLEHVETVRTRNAEQRTWLASELSAMGLKVLPSQTNFLLVRFGDKTNLIEAALLERGVILRPMGAYGLSEHLRITIAGRAENERLLAVLKECMA